METAKQLKKHKSELKRNLTKEERYVESVLINMGIPYKKQMILGFYIMDFILPTKMINMEIDGGVHNDRKTKDQMRDNFTRKCGFSVIRIKNEDVSAFDYKYLLGLPDFDLKDFRRGLALGNSYRSKAIIKEKIIL